MKYIYTLQIDASSEQVAEITQILGVEPNDSSTEWKYKLVEKENDEYINFTEQFTAILVGKYNKLENIGITRDDITIWMIYEYEGQCNMEFSPDEMKKLGDNGISFCISCCDVWDYSKSL